MPPRKRAAKKTTAKKTAAPKVEPVVAEGEVQEQAPPEAYTGPAFPLSGGFYLATPSISRASVSKGPVVAQVRKALGVGPGNNYDRATRDAVVAFQSGAGLPVTGVVTREVWEALHAAPVAAPDAG